MRYTNVLLPGVEELLMTTGESNIEIAIKKCFENPKLEILILKNGSKGSEIYTRNGVKKIDAYKVEQLDATGAGDCFDGAFIAGLVQGKDVEEAARMGAAAGALNAAAFGPMEGKISPETLLDMIESSHVN
ncbi:hypothetical protein CG709_05910 [Lachnotalea glycerini]|nr:hypothetical protein CG709_05910 [Lachnotalea glycerini]